MPIGDVLKILAVHGPFGIFCAVFLWGYISKDRALTAAQKEHLDKQESLMAAHAEAIAACQERYVKNVADLADKYRQRAESLEELIDLLSHQKG